METTETAKTTNATEATPTTEAQAKPNLPACPCGHTRADVGQTPYVEAKSEWGVWGWFYLLVGITAVPKIVRFHCRKCNQEFDQTTDPAILKTYI